jgi:uncharacterized protein
MKRSGPRRPRDRASGGRRLQEPRTKFAVDAMHGSLARKLRAFGFDSAYYERGDDAGLIEKASRGSRLIVSSDRSLVVKATSQGVPAILLKGRSDGTRLGEISRGAAGFGITLQRGDPLCSLCGGKLTPLRKEGVAGLIPLSVVARHRLFYRCTRCGQLYWHGGHWKKLRSLARRLGKNQLAASK